MQSILEQITDWLKSMIIEHNNLANFETCTFFRWVFKTFLAVTLISNTFNIMMSCQKHRRRLNLCKGEGEVR